MARGHEFVELKYSYGFYSPVAKGHQPAVSGFLVQIVVVECHRPAAINAATVSSLLWLEAKICNGWILHCVGYPVAKSHKDSVYELLS